MQDLLLRRILCHSLLGRSERATEELEKASWLIPHEATGRLIAGLVHSKAGAVAEANTAFQQAGRPHRVEFLGPFCVASVGWVKFRVILS